MGLGSSLLDNKDANTDMDNINKVKKEERKRDEKKDLEAIIIKILSNPIYKERLKDDEDTMKKFAKVLCTPSEMKEAYLNTDWVETMEFQKSLEKEDEMEIEKNKKSFDLSSKSETTEKDIQIKEKIKLELTEEELKQIELDPDIQMKNLKNKIKVKLIVAEVANTEITKNFRKLLCPVLSKFDVLPEFGMFHSALMIGPWLIEWNNSALCIPRKCVSKAALLSADIDSISTDKRVEEVVDILADVITEWNVTKKYKDNSKNKKEEANCQDFVHEILEKLGIKLDFKGPLGQFLTNLRETGLCDMEFPMDNNFRQCFNIKEKSKKFNTHEDLDNFVHYLQKTDMEFELKYKNEWVLLKSFDRAFWMRYYKFPNDTRWCSCKKKDVDEDGDVEYSVNCPFGDPEESYSIRFLK